LRSIDVELVTLGVFHGDGVVVNSFLAEHTGNRGTETSQPLGLGIRASAKSVSFMIVRSGRLGRRHTATEQPPPQAETIYRPRACLSKKSVMGESNSP
jgi:hypothetical protein